jgi:DNA modification methylase
MKLPISKLVNNTGQIEGLPANPRQIDKTDYERLLKSLKEDPDFLVHKPLHVYEHNDKYVVLGGNQRLKALKELGYKDVPVTIYDPETPVEVLKRRVIIDNSTFGDYDMDMLANEWDSEPLDDWGVDLPDDWLEQEPEIVEDEAPEVSNEPPVSKLGEIYQLGRHRVMCGNSTESSDVLTLIDGSKIDMVYTDPPYGINEKGDRSNRGGLGKGDLAKAKKYDDFIDDSIEYAVQAFEIVSGLEIKRQVWWGANYYAHHVPQSNNWFVWDKRVEEKQHDTQSDCELAWVKSEFSSIRIFRHLWKGMMKASENGQGRVHPTQKPIALAVWAFDYFKDVNTVLDLFLGSGSTLIACEQTDRTCYGMELDPKYVDVIRKRYHKFVTGSEEGWQDATPAI